MKATTTMTTTMMMTMRNNYCLVLGVCSFMQIQIPSAFGEGDEGFMLNLLDEMLHPRAGAVCLSQQYINELEKRPGYLLLLMVPSLR